MGESLVLELLLLSLVRHRAADPRPANTAGEAYDGCQYRSQNGYPYLHDEPQLYALLCVTTRRCERRPSSVLGRGEAGAAVQNGERGGWARARLSPRLLRGGNQSPSALRGRSLAVEAEEIPFMSERNLAGELSLLATEVDSLAKSLVQARAELAREADRRTRADTKAEELRQELGRAKRRAQTAERELGKLTAGIEATAHAAQGYQRELETRLEQAEQVNERFRQEVQRKERQRRALEANLREVMENLRNAAHEAQGSGVVTGAALPEEATVVPPQRSDGGW